ncbi:winged helix-turn-helix domain-containing protein [Candidatus Shapirobacteria bacterium]|nr:winged helix-turn-helix domain-containing protein [Candidatus Shapirobacteria bacterium]
MLTTWEYSVKSEAERLIHCAHQMIVGFYKSNGFTVLPTNPNINNAHTVTFSDLPYNTIPRFWDQVKKVDVNSLPITIDSKTLNSTVGLLEQCSLKTPNFVKTKDLWEQAESAVIAEIYKIIPSRANSIKKIIIYPTSFGTSCSFNGIETSDEVIMYLREDQGIHAIAEAIITFLTRDDVFKKLKGMWSESEIITDYLVTETSIATVLQKYESASAYIPTLKGIRTKDLVKLNQESDKFYQKLGIPSFDKPFSHVESTPKIFDKPIENLTDTEKSLALALIKNSNQIVDFDSLGNAIFKSEDDFSLYAISKTIQRLRDKFEANGISGSYIQTLRGKGYMLKN